MDVPDGVKKIFILKSILNAWAGRVKILLDFVVRISHRLEWQCLLFANDSMPIDRSEKQSLEFFHLYVATLVHDIFVFSALPRRNEIGNELKVN